MLSPLGATETSSAENVTLGGATWPGAGPLTLSARKMANRRGTRGANGPVGSQASFGAGGEDKSVVSKCSVILSASEESMHSALDSSLRSE